MTNSSTNYKLVACAIAVVVVGFLGVRYLRHLNRSALPPARRRAVAWREITSRDKGVRMFEYSGRSVAGLVGISAESHPADPLKLPEARSRLAAFCEYRHITPLTDGKVVLAAASHAGQGQGMCICASLDSVPPWWISITSSQESLARIDLAALMKHLDLPIDWTHLHEVSRLKREPSVLRLAGVHLTMPAYWFDLFDTDGATPGATSGSFLHPGSDASLNISLVPKSVYTKMRTLPNTIGSLPEGEMMLTITENGTPTKEFRAAAKSLVGTLHAKLEHEP